MAASGWIGVDLDGTLAHYGGWNGKIGPPIMPMVTRIKGWLAEGREVRIFTARVSGCEEESADQVAQIKAWTKEHIGTELEVTCKKDFSMIELWDDRAIRVQKNVGEPCCSYEKP